MWGKGSASRSSAGSAAATLTPTWRSPSRPGRARMSMCTRSSTGTPPRYGSTATPRHGQERSRTSRATSPRASRTGCGGSTTDWAAADDVWQRIGRIREKSRGVGAHDAIDVIAGDNGRKARAITRERPPLAGTMIPHPGVCCLCTSMAEWDEDALWRTCTALTDVEAVFRVAHVRARPASHLPSDPDALRRAPVHHRDRRPAGADHPSAPRRKGRKSPRVQPREAAADHRNLPPQGRPYPPCANGYTRRVPATQDLRCARPRFRSGTHQEDDRLIPDIRRRTPEMSCPTGISAPVAP